MFEVCVLLNAGLHSFFFYLFNLTQRHEMFQLIRVLVFIQIFK